VAYSGAVKGECEATELNDVDTAVRRLEEWRAHIPKLVARLSPYVSLRPGDAVLDIGAAQGVTVTAFLEAGYAARGVEPSAEALATRLELIERTGVETDIVVGVAEALPFDDAEFDYVHCYSVMEHVDDPWRVFGEAFRVLKSGGGFYFSTTSALSPRQAEITGFPFFPWYPDPLRRRIMAWAVRDKPSLVGHTKRPAYYWFKHGEVRDRLSEVGFRRVVDRWEMRRDARELSGVRALFVDAAARNRGGRLVGDILVPGMEYLAVK
jgi:SAM-dependent methyltransferase